jgi:hypothetical protein
MYGEVNTNSETSKYKTLLELDQYEQDNSGTYGELINRCTTKMYGGMEM